VERFEIIRMVRSRVAVSPLGPSLKPFVQLQVTLRHRGTRNAWETSRTVAIAFVLVASTRRSPWCQS